MNTHNNALPPLPEGCVTASQGDHRGRLLEYSGDDLKDYASVAIEPYAKRIAELEAARIAYASEFPPNKDGEPDVGSIHANIRKLKADLEAYRKCRGEPYAQLIVVDKDDTWPQLVYLKEVNLEPGIHDLFLSPQPTEPVRVTSDALINATRQLVDWAEHEVGADLDLTPGLATARALLARYTAPVAAQPPAIFCDEEHVAVPRGLIGAAISAIDKKREGTKLLTELRRYTTGDLSTPVAYQSQNIAETAKRVLIALRADDLGDLLRASDHGPLAAITRALTVQPQAPAAQGDAIAEDDDGMPVGFAGWYNRRFAMLEVDTSRTSYCEDAWRAALKENSNG